MCSSCSSSVVQRVFRWLVILSVFSVSTSLLVPEFNIDSIDSLTRHTDADGTRRYYYNIQFLKDGNSFLVGAMDYLFLGSVGLKKNVSERLKTFSKRSDKLAFSFEDDPLFLCQQDDQRKFFCGSHVRLMIPLSSLGLTGSKMAIDGKFYSNDDDFLVCATSGGDGGSAIYILNGTSLTNLRQVNIETSSALSDDDPFATPHELYFKARMLCPEYPEQYFAFTETKFGANGGNSVVWIVGLWLRKIGLQLKTFSELDIVPYEDNSVKDGRQGALSTKLTSTLFQPPRSILSGVGEFVGLHLSNSPTGLFKNVVFAFLRQEFTSRVLLVDVLDTKSTPSDSDIPFEKTFNKVLALSFICVSSFPVKECQRHGFCFSNIFKYPLVQDFKVVGNDTIVALFSTPPASWGSRSAVCVANLSTITELFNNCASTKKATNVDEIYNCDADALVPPVNNTYKTQFAVAVFEAEGVFTRLEIVRDNSDATLRVAIATEEGKLFKGHLKRENKQPWTFTCAAILMLNNREKISNFVWHLNSQSLFFTTEMAVYSLRLDNICSHYLRIRHCLKDRDCSWNFDNRVCVAKKLLNSNEKPCLASRTENVHINASQGSTVRLVCNPPCEFEASVRWELPKDMDKNKYLIMDDTLVLFDMFAARSRANTTESDVISVRCYADNQTLTALANTTQSLVNFSIFKTCGAFCQRNRNMEAWCLKTWKQKIGLPTDSSRYLRT